MADWSNYPPLPPPPKWPEWRGSPLVEGIYESPIAILPGAKPECIGFICFWGACAAGILILMNEYHQWTSWFVALWYALLTTLFLYLIARLMLFFGVLLLLLARYGFEDIRRRPDLSGPVEEILAARPVFDEEEFRRCWPTPALADRALEILGWVRENWQLPDKMLYPNDSLMLLYEHRLIGDPEDYEDNFYKLLSPGPVLNYDDAFADLVERCKPPN